MAGFPTEAIRFCLKAAGATPEQLDGIALSRNPRVHLLFKARRALLKGPLSSQVHSRMAVLGKTLRIKTTLAEHLGIPLGHLKAPAHFVEHHRAHIASSFYPSGWEKAVILSLDGFGDSLSGMWGVAEGPHLRVAGEVSFPHSLGILYTALTQFLGFLQWGDEYKVMGLASYGNPERYRDSMKSLVREIDRGGYQLNLRYFRHHDTDVSMTWESGPPTLGTLFADRMEDLLGPRRQPESPLDQRHADIAAALQERLETVILHLLQHLWERFRIPRLCYAGGVALNCSLNGKILRQTPFQEVFIQPAAHDAGTSLGAAFYTLHHLLRKPRCFTMRHAAWGPEATESTCHSALAEARLPFRRMDPRQLTEIAAAALANGKIIGWFEGRMEFGPRALGHRSLLADPRDPKMKERINARVKRRESFRPFAPSILAEKVPEFFPEGHPDPFMLFAYPVHPTLTSKIPAVTHVDGTCRLQGVDQVQEPLYWQLLKAFEARTGVPVLLNTSFNEQEPIVCRPEEAIACFARNEIDALALGPFWVKSRNPAG